MFNPKRRDCGGLHHVDRTHRSLWRYFLASGVLAFSLGMSGVDNPLTLPAAHAHHGGGGGGSGGGGSGGGGKGDGTKPAKSESATRPASGDGHGKGGRGFEGLKP